MEKPQREKLKPKFRVKGSGQGDIIGVESGLKKTVLMSYITENNFFFFEESRHERSIKPVSVS
jgi:hypothetical protein